MKNMFHALLASLPPGTKELFDFCYDEAAEIQSEKWDAVVKAVNWDDVKTLKKSCLKEWEEKIKDFTAELEEKSERSGDDKG